MKRDPIASKSRKATGRALLHGPLTTLILGLPFAGALSAYAAQDPVGDARAAIERWVETRRLISQEKRDWALGKEMLEDRIELVQQEIGSLRTRIEEAQKSITDADEKRTELVEESERLKATSSALVDVVVGLEARTRGLLPRLPEPARERVALLSQRLPKDPSETKLTVGERFLNVVGILNEVNKFQRQVSVTSEVRSLANGTTAQVTAMYLGIGQGYYVSAMGDAAGIGSGSGDEWSWRPVNDAAGEVAHAIATFRNEEAAGFVRLPVRVE